MCIIPIDENMYVQMSKWADHFKPKGVTATKIFIFTKQLNPIAKFHYWRDKLFLAIEFGCGYWKKNFFLTN